jgi:cysteine desulfurase
MLDDARSEIATFLGSSPALTHIAPTPAVAAERIVTGIGAARRGRLRAVVSAVESVAVLTAARRVAPDGCSLIQVDHTGRVEVDAFARALSEGEVAFAALQHGNREVGTIQPLDQAYAAAFVAKVPLVVDATATIGRVAPPSSWDALVADPSNWGGPGGMGILALRPGLRWVPAWADGAPWATGSVNIPGAVAAAVALRLREAERVGSAVRMALLEDRLRAGLRQIPHTIELGHPNDRLPYLAAVTFVYADGGGVARRLDALGIAVGHGCSCGDDPEVACPTLVAMGAMTHGAIRIGLHPGLDERSIDRVIAAAVQSVRDERDHLEAPR